MKKRLRTSTAVPTGIPVASAFSTRPPLILSCQPASEAASRDCRLNIETAAIEGSASPRKPSVVNRNRSASVSILLVACRSTERKASSLDMPLPLSWIRISFLPPDSTSIRISSAPASREFSTSSLTTEAGRSTTSPAAILLQRSSGRIFIWLIGISDWPTNTNGRTSRPSNARADSLISVQVGRACPRFHPGHHPRPGCRPGSRRADAEGRGRRQPTARSWASRRCLSACVFQTGSCRRSC